MKFTFMAPVFNLQLDHFYKGGKRVELGKFKGRLTNNRNIENLVEMGLLQKMG